MTRTRTAVAVVAALAVGAMGGVLAERHIIDDDSDSACGMVADLAADVDLRILDEGEFPDRVRDILEVAQADRDTEQVDDLAEVLVAWDNDAGHSEESVRERLDVSWDDTVEGCGLPVPEE